MNPSQRLVRPGLAKLDRLARSIGASAATSGSADPQEVWELAEEHRRSLDSRLRSALGIFYTPPAVADRLIADLESAGARLDGSQRFCDPACR